MKYTQSEQTLSTWETKANAPCALANGEIHIYAQPLSCSDDSLLALSTYLNESELTRARSYTYEKDQKTSIITRATLKQILARYVNTPPQEIHLSYGERGKPYLSAAYNGQDIRFNVTNTKEYALFAFCIGAEIGIDAEYNRAVSDLETLANETLSERERAVLFNEPEERQIKRFFEYWTHKEAYLKATGEGLCHELHDIEFLPETGTLLSLVSVTGTGVSPNRWQSFHFRFESSYDVAIITQKGQWSLAYYAGTYC